MQPFRTIQNEVFTEVEIYLTGLIIELAAIPPIFRGGRACGRVAAVCPLLRCPVS